MAKSDFARIVQSHRGKHLRWTAASVRRIDRILQYAAADVAAKLRQHAGRGTLQERYLTDLLADLGRTLDNLRDDYGHLTNLHLLGSAQIAADREAAIAGQLFSVDDLQQAVVGLLPELTQSATIGGIGEVSVRFGLVAQNAVNAVYQRVYRDGLSLSDRLWRLSAGTRKVIEDKVVAAVAQGTSAENLARDLRSYLTKTGQGNARYNAMRLARTEINTAHREGSIISATKPDGTLRDHVQAIGWRLSMSHPEPDICDVWASQDIDGLGPGNYLPQNVPVDHPHGLCFIVSVLKAHPEMQHVTKEPEPDKVPDSEMRRYGFSGGEERVDVERLPKNPAAADREARQIASTPLERDTSKSQKPNLGAMYPHDMPAGARRALADFEVVSKSPYSDSFYDITNKGWGDNPNGSLRLSDHWNWEKGGDLHEITDRIPPPNSWTLARLDNGVYRVMDVWPKVTSTEAIDANRVAKRLWYAENGELRQVDKELLGRILERGVVPAGEPERVSVWGLVEKGTADAVPPELKGALPEDKTKYEYDWQKPNYWWIPSQLREAVAKRLL